MKKTRYTIQAMLGRGGMGAVYLADDRLNRQTVALKRVEKTAEEMVFYTQSDVTNARLALAQEFQTLAALRHPNIIAVMDYGFEDSDAPFFTMEYLDGAQTILDAAESLSLDQKFDLILQMLQAVVYLHRRGVLHRDLKPSNVLTRDGHVFVLDFGLALNIKDSRKQADDDMVAGTLVYMSPEQVLNNALTPASDVYTLGLMIYEILTGDHLYRKSGDDDLLRIIMFEELDVHDVGLPDPVAFVIHRMLAKTVEDRLSDVSDIIRRLCAAFNRPLPPETRDIRESFLQRASFVGREVEYSLLTNVVRRAKREHGAIWLIGGESGVGKSRLLDEVRTLALVEGYLVLRGQAISEGGTGYQLWRDAIRMLLVYSAIDDREASFLQLIVPDLEALLGRAVPPVPSLDAGLLNIELLQVISTLFGRQPQPLLMILEDLHWANSENVALLNALAATTATTKLLIVGTYRNDERPDLPQAIPGAQTLTLNRLSSDSIARLSASMLGPSSKAAGLLAFLERETEGNAFFLVETVRELAEQSGTLENIGTEALPQFITTGGIREIIQRRLSQVPDDAREILKLAAVGGRQIDLPVLEHVAGESLIQWLIVCQNVMVLDANERGLRFSHDKLREGLLNDLDSAESAALHRRFAEGIEAVHTDLPERAAALAYLWRIAGDIEKELIYSRTAAERALAVNATQEAIGYLERINALLSEHHADDPAYRDQELVAQTLLANALMSIRGYGDASVEKAYSRAHELSTLMPPAAQFTPILAGLFSFYSTRGEYGISRGIAGQLHDMARTFDEAVVYVAAHNNFGLLDFLTGNFASALDHTRKAVMYADQVDAVALIPIYTGDIRGYPRVWLAMSQCMLGLADQSMRTLEEAVNLLGHHAFTKGFVLCFSAVPVLLQDVEETRRRAQETLAIANQYGFVLLRLGGALQLGWTMVKSGQSEGIETMLQCLQVLKMIKFDAFIPYYLGLLADAYLTVDDTASAEASLNEAFTFVAAAGANFYEAQLHLLQSRLAQRKEQDGTPFIQKALALSRTQGALLFELRAALALAGHLPRAEAVALIQPLYARFTEGFETADLRVARQFLAE